MQIYRRLFKSTIPIIHINSAIDAKAVKVIENSLKHISRPKALAVVVNSGGGYLVQGELINTKLKNYAAEKQIPIYTFAEDLALSGGYFILSIGDKIYVDSSSLVGSVGVITLMWKMKQFARIFGIEARRFSSNENLFSNQSILDDVNQEQNDKLEVLLKNWRKQFIEHVLEHRKQIKQQSSEIQDLIFNANIFNGNEAIKYGLADELGTYQQVLNNLYPDCVLKNVTHRPFFSQFKDNQYV